MRLTKITQYRVLEVSLGCLGLSKPLATAYLLLRLRLLLHAHHLLLDLLLRLRVLHLGRRVGSVATERSPAQRHVVLHRLRHIVPTCLALSCE